MSLQYKIVPVTAFEQNCSILWCDKTKEAVVVDPGGDIPKILAAIQESDLNLTKIILTHAHIDHAGATAELSESYELPIEGPQEEDKFWIDSLPQHSQMFGRSFTKICGGVVGTFQAELQNFERRKRRQRPGLGLCNRGLFHVGLSASLYEAAVPCLTRRSDCTSCALVVTYCWSRFVFDAPDG